MCVSAPAPLDVCAVLAALPGDSAILHADFAERCAALFAKQRRADGLLDAEAAVLEAVPQERQALLGVSAANAAGLLSRLDLLADPDDPAVSQTGFLTLCRWAAAEHEMKLAQGQVVPLQLPRGEGSDGVESVRQCLDALQRGGADAEVCLVRLGAKCSAEDNPRGFRACRAAAQADLATLLQVCRKPGWRSRALEALARALCGAASAPGAVACAAPALDGSVVEQFAGLCVLSALAPQAGAALQAELCALVPRVVELATGTGPGSVDSVRVLGLTVLCQLATHPALRPELAALSADHVAQLVGAELGACERFDLDVCLLHLGTRHDPAAACRGLGAALEASLAGEEWPLGSRAFRRPRGLVEAVLAACRAGLSHRLRACVAPLLRLVPEVEDDTLVLEALAALCASRANAEDVLAAQACIAGAVSESVAARAGKAAEAGERALALAAAKVSEEPATFDAEEFAQHGEQGVLGALDAPVVWLAGAAAEAPTVWCRDIDLLVEALDVGVVCWDGAPPSLAGRVDEYVSSFTAALERALRRHPRLVACAFVPDLAAAAPWYEASRACGGRLRFYQTGLCAGPAAERVLSLGLGGLAADDGARALGGAEWTVYPADGDAWGGMALTTPCRLRAGHAAALNEAWTLTWEEEEWRVC